MSVFDRYFELKSSKKPVKLIKEENAYLKRLKELNTPDEIKPELLNEMAPPSPMQYAQLRRPPETIEEKWDKDVKIKSTGAHTGKSVAQLKAEVEALKGKPGNKEKMGELLFALRAKQGWKKKTGL